MSHSEVNKPIRQIFKIAESFLSRSDPFKNALHCKNAEWTTDMWWASNFSIIIQNNLVVFCLTKHASTLEIFWNLDQTCPTNKDTDKWRRRALIMFVSISLQNMWHFKFWNPKQQQNSAGLVNRFSVSNNFTSCSCTLYGTHSLCSWIWTLELANALLQSKISF